MSDRYFLKTLGCPELMGADGRALRFKVRKHLALLIYLAVDYRGAHTRDALVELFWGWVDVERGRHSLSVALSVLRSTLGSSAIQSTNSHVRLIRTALTLDLDLLERGAVLGSEDFPRVDVDRFLLDFEIDDAPAFQHWRDRHHAQLLPAIQAAFLTLADHARRSGDMRTVLTFAERLLVLDPLSEEGIRAKVIALAMQGDRVSALRAYEEWKDELGRQLSAAPSELLEAIAGRLRRRSVERTAATATPTEHADRWAGRQFVGRAAEFRELVDAWESTTQFDTRHILLSGESGIGKSTLAMRFGAAVALEGAAVARVQCFELEQRIAFGMIGALVSSLLDKPGVVATAPESLSEIARAVPRVRERFPNLPLPRKTEGETARMHFAEGTFALFDAIMDEQPLLLIVDDYPRSDEASLSVLHMLLRRTDRAMVVLTGRSAEAGESAQARRIREGVSYLPIRHIELSPLTEEEGDSMLSALLKGAGKEAAASTRRAILQAGRGNPMALDLLAQDWVANGEAALAISLPAMSSDMPASALEAVGYDRLIERMLPDLAPRTRSALQLAAILGPRLNDLDSFDIADLTAAQTLEAMTALVDRRLLRDVGGRLEFINELIRARLYLKIPSAVRIRMHDGVANRLLAAAEVGENVPGLEIAWHCIRARRRAEATPFLMSGARDAILHGAPDEAVRALSSALGHLKGRAKDEAAVLLAETYQEMAEWKASLDCLDELAVGHKRDQHVRELGEALRIENLIQLGHYSVKYTRQVLQRLLTKAENDRNPRSRVLAIGSATTFAFRIGQPALLDGIVNLADDISQANLEPRDRGRLLLVRALNNYYRRENANGLKEALEGIKLLSELGATDTTFVELQTGLGAIACINGAYADAIKPLEAAYLGAIRLDNSQLILRASSNLALCYHRTGADDKHLHWANVARNRSKSELPGSYDRIIAEARYAFACLSLGRKEAARDGLSGLRAEVKETSVQSLRQIGMLLLADVTWLSGEKAGALRIVEKIREESEQPLSLAFEGTFIRWSTIFLLKTGRPEIAERLLAASLGRFQRLDAIDRAEILCSKVQLNRFLGSPMDEWIERARASLANLPVPCAKHLYHLGLLLPN